MLQYDQWLERCEQIPEGRSKRVTHCNNNKTMSLWVDEQGWHSWCFRCNDGGFKPYGQRNLHQLFAKTYDAGHGFEHSTPKLPDDFTLDIPDDHALWLYRHGIHQDISKFYSIGYSDSMKRIILPVYNDGELVVVQARAVLEWLKPKYLNQGGNNKSDYLFRSHMQGGDTVCITEDILSCIKVGTVMPCVSALGTKLSSRQESLLSVYSNIIIWLDNDKAGYDGARKMYKSLSLLHNVSIETSMFDPKCYPTSVIKEKLL